MILDIVYQVVSVITFRVAEDSEENKMSIINLASIFGPVLMTVDNVSYTTSTGS